MGKYINSKTNQEISILGMYDLVFEDMVRSYLENVNYEGVKLELNEEDIKRIAYKMIYKNDYIWEVIDEVIKNEMGYILKEKENK